MVFNPTSSVKRSFVYLAVASLSACGGGDSTNTPPAAPVQVTPYSQSDVKTAAATGLLLVNLSATQAQVEQSFFAALLEGFINAPAGGSLAATTIPCAVNGLGSGSFTTSVTRAGIYAGLRTNDILNFTFNSCVFGSAAGLTLNGSTSLTSGNTYTSLAPAFLIQYNVVTTNFDFITSAGKIRSNGNQSVTFDARTAGTSLPEISVLAGAAGYGSSFFTPATATVPSISNTLKSGGTIYSRLGTGSTFVSGVNGVVDIVTSSGMQSFTLVTNTRLSGSTASGSAVPTAGNLSAKNNTLNLQTVVSIQGLNATVQADTNQDGTLDSTTTSSYALLIL